MMKCYRYTAITVNIVYFRRAGDTVLGETADKTELFLVDECDDMEAEDIEGKASVIHHKMAADWYEQGGLVEGESPVPKEEHNSYFYQKWSVDFSSVVLLCVVRALILV